MLGQQLALDCPICGLSLAPPEVSFRIANLLALMPSKTAAL